jgi:hypothetical protein
MQLCISVSFPPNLCRSHLGQAQLAAFDHADEFFDSGVDFGQERDPLYAPNQKS